MTDPPETRASTDSPVEEVRPEKKTALTITIQSWATPLLGLVMLVIGLLGGYYARPLLAPPPASSTTASSQTSAGAPDAAASQAELMEAVVAQTRHFKGDPEAPVTIVEFGDFQ